MSRFKVLILFAFCFALSSPSFSQVPGLNGSGVEKPRISGTSKLPLPGDDEEENAYTSGYSLSKEEEEALQLELDAESDRLSEEVRQRDFDAAVELLLPMRPDEIVKMLEVFRNSREAAETPLSTPEAKVHVQTISLDPGVTPPIVYTSFGHMTTLTVLDMTGAPWPIQDFGWAGSFAVTPPSEEGGHVIRVTPTSAHGVGNISMRLVGLITPVTFSLRTGYEVSHYRFDARIPKMGPLAKIPLIDHGGLSAVAGEDAYMVSVLDGAPPSSAEKLSVTGVDGRTTAWRLNDLFYVRTPFTLLSPAWNSSVVSADGMNVYSINEAPVLLLSDGGKMVRARIDLGENN